MQVTLKNLFEFILTSVFCHSRLICFREFTMAEIEHFCDPKDKSHPKFDTVKDLEVTLYSACNQMEGKLPEKCTIGKAVEEVCRAIICVIVFMRP